MIKNGIVEKISMRISYFLDYKISETEKELMIEMLSERGITTHFTEDYNRTKIIIDIETSMEKINSEMRKGKQMIEEFLEKTEELRKIVKKYQRG